MKPFLFIALVVALVACKDNDKPANGTDGPKAEGPRLITYSIVNTYPHDTSSFTEGLLIYKGEMYESTGEKGRSRLMKVDIKTGRILQSIDLDSKYFGEGMVIVNDTVYQLTYQDKIGFMYTLKDFKRIKEFKFASNEGWGMTFNGKEIVASDGTSNLYFYEPGSFRLIRKMAVTEAGTLVSNINELEYIDGFIYANQWQYPYILKIDPATGQVVGKADLSDITNRIKNNYPYADFINGIAFDDSTKKIYVTGKKWPELYELQLSK